jgi:hypothetical protein
MSEARSTGTRRHGPRLSERARARSTALIAASAGLMIAAVIGLQLGQSAVSEIDPVHFQGPAAPPVGVETVTASPAGSEPFSQPYVWSQSGPPGAAECVGDCEARQARAAAAAFAGPVETRDLSAPYWRDVTPTTELRPWRPGALPNRGLSVERYMHYPVTQDQAAETAAVAEEAAAPAAPVEDSADD